MRFITPSQDFSSYWRDFCFLNQSPRGHQSWPVRRQQNYIVQHTRQRQSTVVGVFRGGCCFMLLNPMSDFEFFLSPIAPHADVQKMEGKKRFCRVSTQGTLLGARNRSAPTCANLLAADGDMHSAAVAYFSRTLISTSSSIYPIFPFEVEGKLSKQREGRWGREILGSTPYSLCRVLTWKAAVEPYMYFVRRT